MGMRLGNGSANNVAIRHAKSEQQSGVEVVFGSSRESLNMLYIYVSALKSLFGIQTNSRINAITILKICVDFSWQRSAFPPMIMTDIDCFRKGQEES